MIPDEALIRHLERQKRLSDGNDCDSTAGETDSESINCLVFWARPSPATLSLLDSLQRRIVSLVGSDVHLIPQTDLHLSVLELSHRHPVSHLHSVAEKVGAPRIQRILDTPHGRPYPRLVAPRLVFDRKGVALSFLPSPNDEDDCGGGGGQNGREHRNVNDQDHNVNNSIQPWTYHHLRSAMHSIALESGISIDLCYTAPSAHITFGRFVSTDNFFNSPSSSATFLNLIREINVELRRRWPESLALNLGLDGDDGDDRDDTMKDKGDCATDALEWRVGKEKSLELQLGYLKFGRKRELAYMTGSSP